MRAVDRFYRRIQTINKQIPNIDLSVEASKIALYATYIRVTFYLQVLKEHFNGKIIWIRVSLYISDQILNKHFLLYRVSH